MQSQNSFSKLQISDMQLPNPNGRRKRATNVKTTKPNRKRWTCYEYVIEQHWRLQWQLTSPRKKKITHECGIIAKILTNWNSISYSIDSDPFVHYSNRWCKQMVFFFHTFPLHFPRAQIIQWNNFICLSGDVYCVPYGNCYQYQQINQCTLNIEHVRHLQAIHIFFFRRRYAKKCSTEPSVFDFRSSFSIQSMVFIRSIYVFL